MEAQHRALAKEKLAAIMGAEEIIYMPGEDQDFDAGSPAGLYLPFPTERLPISSVPGLPAVSAGSARPEDTYNNLPIADRQALRLIAVFMNKMSYAIKAFDRRVEYYVDMERPLESNNTSDDSNDSSNDSNEAKIPVVWFQQGMEELNDGFFTIRGQWLNTTKEGTCFRKRAVDYC